MENNFHDLPRIRFTSDGSILIYEEANKLQCWHVQERRLLHQQDGRLIGVSRDSRSMLLELMNGGVQAFDVYSGQVIPLETLSLEQYEPGQRSIVRWKRESIEVFDVLKQEVSLQIERDSLSKSGYFSNACYAQNGAFIAVTISGDGMWGEWAKGYLLHGNGTVHFEFDVNPHIEIPLLDFDAQATYLVVENDSLQYTLWEVATGKEVAIWKLSDRKAGRFTAIRRATSGLIIAAHDASNRVRFVRGSPSKTTIDAVTAILHGEFCPDDQHIALLTDNKEIVFYDWRTGQRTGSIIMSDSQ